ncbi:hypothetical protein [Salinispora sp. H7-4]|uniref:hypothetical protein n=1 Tax=Salinispora sp. H7-4 TaxID=2748321 RepID=UPI002107F4E9|nr:hypothetical protein [Salinispora sp. H7-4]
MSDRLNVAVEQLSGGEGRRLELALAVLGRARCSSSTSPPPAWTRAPGAALLSGIEHGRHLGA